MYRKGLSLLMLAPTLGRSIVGVVGRHLVSEYNRGSVKGQLMLALQIDLILCFCFHIGTFNTVN